jgi:hypothetical protein
LQRFVEIFGRLVLLGGMGFDVERSVFRKCSGDFIIGVTLREKCWRSGEFVYFGIGFERSFGFLRRKRCE